MQKKYETLQCEIILSQKEDILTASVEKDQPFKTEWLNGDFEG